ncbi:MAG: BA14K family protein [Pseudolabrys sp.]
MLLGLDLMTLPQNPDSRSVSTPNKLAQHEADRRAEKTEGDPSRPLTPLYPANPGGARDVRVIYPPGNQPTANETTGAAPADEPRAEAQAEPKTEQNSAAVQPQPAAPTPPEQQNARVPQPAPKPMQAVARASNHCDVQACTKAYSSFRAADCTYQPFVGPRRACTAPPAQRWAEHVQPHATIPAQAQREMEPRTVEPENAAMEDDDDDDSAGLMGGRRVIILDPNYRPWR